MRLTQLEYLVALNEYRSVSKAAEHLYVTQPTISHAIKELEQELGYPLMIRSNRGITFTDQGNAVLEKAAEILEGVSDIRKLQTTPQPVSGNTQVACTEPFCKSLMLDVLLTLRREQPEIGLSVVGANSREVIRMLQQRDCQLGIIHLEDIDRPSFFSLVEAGELSYGELFTDTLTILAREDHPLAKMQAVQEKDLLDYPLVTPNKNVNPSLCKLYEDAGLSHQIVSISDTCALRRFAFLDYPIIVSPLRSAIDSNALFQGQLVQLHVEGAAPACTVCWVHGKGIDAVTQTVLELLLQHANGKNI